MAVQVPSVKETRADSFFRISVCGNPVFSTTNGNFKCGGFADLAHFSYSEHYTFVVTFAIYTFVGCADNPKIPAALTVTKYAGFFEIQLDDLKAYTLSRNMQDSSRNMGNFFYVLLMALALFGIVQGINYLPSWGILLMIAVSVIVLLLLIQKVRKIGWQKIVY